MRYVTMISRGERYREETAELLPSQEDGSFFGKLSPREPHDLLGYVEACAKGELEIMLDGTAYRVSEISLDGQFKAER
jgi:hypothetical protein